VTFQAIMNKLLRNLINTGKMVAFIDDVIVGMEEEEEHDELVAEIIKRLEENDFVIKLDGIKMEEEKVKDVLDWLTLKCVKDKQKFLGLANYYH